MSGYYAEKLSAERLKRCYEIAPPRVKQYLEAEIEYVLDKLKATDRILELGCGYGRVLLRLLEKAEKVVGIDTSYASLLMAREFTGNISFCSLIEMDAAELGFRKDCFDAVVCIQNGISAFAVNQRKLVEESVRVIRPGGIALFSSYSEHFWKDRLEWFHLQAEQGLMGEIDEAATGKGVIICKDGFKASTVGPDDFTALTSNLPCKTEIIEVDRSSIFCEIRVEK
ncbi:MAG: class I SAM-dependent methyltransferase [Candidatus Aminicenantes bacterium]|jgi:2-polyprenyl-6-hydroxyphenyl methylase/3-demethylubiquinone-9 3-methyltransferase